jgi:Icc-related predicted phosphoesterase
VREAVVRLKPKLVACGHIHACAGKRANIGDTVVINAGPKGVVIQI